MEFIEKDNKVTIVPDGSEAKDIEIEDLRRQKARNDELEKKMAVIMKELGMTES